jgi:type IV fimbrial biogenesis protein FimT
MFTPMNSLASHHGRRMHGRPRENLGFTLIEMMVVTCIVAILLAVGVPSFRFVTSSNRATTEINGLLGDLQFARAEAIREGQAVKVCATTDGSTCVSSGTTWNTGWLVMTTAATPVILRVQAGFTSQDTLTADNSIKALSFSRDGFSMSLPNAIVFTLHTSPVNAQYTRCLSVTIIGALSTQIGGNQTAEATTC